MKMTSLEMRATELITNLKIITFNLLCKCSGPYFSNKSLRHLSHTKTTITSLHTTSDTMYHCPPRDVLSCAPISSITDRWKQALSALTYSLSPRPSHKSALLVTRPRQFTQNGEDGCGEEGGEETTGAGARRRKQGKNDLQTTNKQTNAACDDDVENLDDERGRRRRRRDGESARDEEGLEEEEGRMPCSSGAKHFNCDQY